MAKTETKAKRKLPLTVKVVVIALIVVLGIYLVYNLNQPSSSSSTREPVIVTPENLQAYLGSSSIVSDMPKESNVELNFGDFQYSVEGKSIQAGGNENPDIKITLPEEYIPKLGYGICNALHEAVANGDLQIETSLSNTELLWKYRALLKYKKCVTG